MKSKETFSELVCMSKWSKERYGIVMKDLEILELLKRKRVNIYLVEYFRNVKAYNELRNSERVLTEEEFIKIKEWLKEDENI